MGLELYLLPFTEENEDGTQATSRQVLSIPKNNDVFDAIDSLPSTRVPAYFGTFFKDGQDMGDTQGTPYGRELKATTMKDLKTCNIPGPCGAFVQASPDEQRVALYWH